ncbi:MAG TPA: low affinity iron permease family protein [Xanthobacteraceae bacterium]|jgi:low affinity Fe/Cu permease|nr:low affinity iron permease family protein [Xanthobacteraceae bacterium]
MDKLRRLLTSIGVWTSNPAAFFVVGFYVALWLVLNPRSFDWQAAATIATWLMTLFIQRAERRDTQAVHAKLDELLRAERKASDALTRVDQEEPETIEAHRASHLRSVRRIAD